MLSKGFRPSLDVYPKPRKMPRPAGAKSSGRDGLDWTHDELSLELSNHLGVLYLTGWPGTIDTL